MRSPLTITILTALFFLNSMASVEARDDKAKSASKAVTIVITDENEKPLEGAKVSIATKCPCDACEKSHQECWVYCCAPNMFSPVMLALSPRSTGDAGVFTLEAGQLAPGDYTIKVEGGRLTKDIDITVEKDHKVELIKAPGVLKMDGVDKAFQVPLSNSKAGA
jgi:hypothetical protein